VENAAALCENHRESVTHHLKKKKKGKHFGHLVTLWFGTFVMPFSATGCVVRHENTQR